MPKGRPQDFRVEPREPISAFKTLKSSGARFPFLLDGAVALSEGRGARSLVGGNPAVVLESRAGRMRRFEAGRWTDEPRDPFDALERLVGGGGLAVGFLSYDLGRAIENTPPHAHDDQILPLMRFGLYRDVWEYNHDRGLWRPAAGLGPRPWIETPPARLGWPSLATQPPLVEDFSLGPWEPSVSKEAYLAAVRRAKELIRDGEIYQVNLSHRFTASFAGDPWAFYQVLRRAHPAPYAAYLEGEVGEAVLSLSPECFLDRQGGEIRTFPIKGTRPSFSDAERDAASRRALEESEKDRAELAMIVDLERNDLGRVARPGSVAVEIPRRLFASATVHHAEAVVAAALREGAGWAHILRATFPGGSVTGCPKIRAMQVLSELEPWARGLYTGSIGWLTPKAGSLNIAIRTVTVACGRAVLNVGGGIVADSDPEAEYAETLDKGRAFLGGAF